MKPLDEATLASLAAALTALPEVRLAYLFGSHARGAARAESDVDLGVLVSTEATRQPRDTLARLFDRLGRIVPSDRLDVVLLNQASSLLRHRVLTHGRPLFVRDPVERVRFTARTIQDYQDMQIRRQFFYRARMAGIREDTPDGGSGDLLAQARRAAKLVEEPRRLPGHARDRVPE